MSKFFIYADGALVSASSVLKEDEYAIDSPSVKMELNRAGSCSFTMKITHKLYNSLKKRLTKVMVWLDDEPLFLGRVMNFTTNIFGDRQVYCEGALAYLNDSQQPPFEKTSKTPRAYFAEIIAEHNRQVENDKHFTVGQVTIDNADKADDFEQTGYTDTLSVLTNTLVSRFGGYFALRYSGDTIYIDWVKEYGHTCAQSIELGSNLVDYSEDDSLEDPWSVLLPYGSDNLTIKDVNKGSLYLEDPDLIALYGRVVKTMNFSEAESPQELLDHAKKWMEKNREEPTSTLSMTVLELHRLNPEIESFSLGDTIPVKLLHLGKNTSYTCTEIEWNLFRANDTKLTLGTPKQKLTDVYLQDRETTSSRINSTNDTVAKNAKYTTEQIGQLGKDINVNARNIAVNAQNIAVNAEKIEVNAKDITLAVSDIKKLGDRTTMTEASITMHDAEIKLRAKQVDLDWTNAQVDKNSDAIGGLETETKTLLSRMSLVEIDINGAEGYIGLKGVTALLEGDVNKMGEDFDTLSNHVDKVGERVTEAEVKIDSMEGEIRLRVRSTEFNDQLDRIDNEIKVNREGISLKVNKNEIISSINLTPEKITIQAKRIDLSGYVTASQLSAELASINNFLGGKASINTARISYLYTAYLTINNTSFTGKAVRVVTGGSITVNLTTSGGTLYAYTSSSSTTKTAFNYVSGVSVNTATFNPSTQWIYYLGHD